MHKLDTNRAEATALCKGIIDPMLPNSTGNLTKSQKHNITPKKKNPEKFHEKEHIFITGVERKREKLRCEKQIGARNSTLTAKWCEK